jgi:hypothetical protein
MLVCAGRTLLRRRLDRVAAQNRVDVAECSVEAAGKCLHARSGAESDKGNNQSILDQILTFLAVHQVLELHIQLDNHGIHLWFLRRLISQPSPGHPQYSNWRAIHGNGFLPL